MPRERRRLILLEATSAQDRLENRVTSLEESSQLLNSKINDQYQTKIEAASKYRIRLSGIVLLNIFGNHGSVDNQDFPTWAIPASANCLEPTLERQLATVGAWTRSIRSPIGRSEDDRETSRSIFRADSPTRRMGSISAGAHAYGQHAGWTGRILRSLRGQDNAFHVSAVADLVRLAGRAGFGYAGNLWGWIPQVRVEHRFDLRKGQNITLQAGMMDNVTGELPLRPSSAPRKPERVRVSPLTQCEYRGHAVYLACH